MTATSRSAPRLALAAFVGLALLSSGCSNGLPPVRGKVQYEDGTPVKGGTVTFNSPELKTSATGVIADDGTFSLASGDKPGAPAGSYKVVVVGNGDVYGAPPAVDDIYGDPLRTPLKQEVTAGPNDVTITVKRPAKRQR